MEAKNRKQGFRPIAIDKKISEIPQMSRLMARKVNFSHLKGNYNNSQLASVVPSAIGPGGFVIPKMYHLNVQS
jgi:hypothetical protein